MNTYMNLVVLFFITWGHWRKIYADDGFNTLSDALRADAIFGGPLKYALGREKRSVVQKERQSVDPKNFEATIPNEGHKLTKRAAGVIPEECERLGFCARDTETSVLCMIQCNFWRFGQLLRPFYGLISELPQLLCQSTSTLLQSIPLRLRSGDKNPSVMKYLQLNELNPDQEADFAKASANALVVNFIKHVRSPIFDSLLPAISKLEILDSDSKTGRRSNSLLSSNTGKFVNQKCSQANLEDEALTLVSAMKTRTCAMDLLLPGYFVFSQAPKVVSTRRISPLLKALNMPLFMFTGVKCCLVQYAARQTRSVCENQYNILNKPHGLPTSNGPNTVCNAIPTLFPFRQQEPPGAPSGSQKPDGSTSLVGTATMVACTENNKDDMEECVTESSVVDYSEEATQKTQGRSMHGKEDIPSDEYS